MSTKHIQNKFGKDVNILWQDTKRIWGMPISFTHYYLIEKPGKFMKLIEQTGILSTSFEEVQVFRIDDLSVYQSFFNNLFGVGTITVFCRDASQNKLILRNVAKPLQTYNMLAEALETDKVRKNVKITEFQSQ